MIYLIIGFVGMVAGATVFLLGGVTLVVLRIARCLPLDRRLWWTFAALVACVCCRQIALADNDYEVPTTREQLAAFNAFIYGGILGVVSSWLMGLAILTWLGRKSANQPTLKIAWPLAMVAFASGVFIAWDNSEAKRENFLAARAEVSRAVRDGDIEKLRELAANGTDLSERYEGLDDQTPFQYAIDQEHLELMRFFLDFPEADRPDLKRWMGDILRTGNREAIDLLFDHGGRTPEFLGRAMNIAITEDARDGFLYALSLGGDPNHMYSYTALMIAAQKNRSDYAEDLLAAGADVNAVHQSAWGDTNKTALAFAAEKGHTQMVRLLLEHGADPSLHDREGMTPIEIARQHEFQEIVTVLDSYSTD